MRLVIVNEQDEVIGYKDREDRDPKEITRVSALWLTDPDGNILLAQRAFAKKDSPGKWGPAVAGSVEEGETYESNIVKEAEEEIGLFGLIPILGPKLRKSTSHEYFGQWFTAVIRHDYEFVRQESEVETFQWFSEDALELHLHETPEMFLKGFEEYFSIFSKRSHG